MDDLEKKYVNIISADIFAVLLRYFQSSVGNLIITAVKSLKFPPLYASFSYCEIACSIATKLGILLTVNDISFLC